MASVPYYWDLDLLVVGQSSFFSGLTRIHSNLEADTHFLVVIGGADISVLKTGTEWVQVEEWVLAVLDLGNRLAIE